MHRRADLEAGERFIVVVFCSKEDRQFLVHIEGNYRAKLVQLMREHIVLPILPCLSNTPCCAYAHTVRASILTGY